MAEEHEDILADWPTSLMTDEEKKKRADESKSLVFDLQQALGKRGC